MMTTMILCNYEEQAMNTKDTVIEDKFYYLDLLCLVTFNNRGFRCGYVEIPITRLLDIDPYMYEAHGGITFCGTLEALEDIDAGLANFVGFDCLHVGDKIDEFTLKKYFPEATQALRKGRPPGRIFRRGATRSKQYVINNIKHLAEQINEDLEELQ